MHRRGPLVPFFLGFLAAVACLALLGRTGLPGSGGGADAEGGGAGAGAGAGWLAPGADKGLLQVAPPAPTRQKVLAVVGVQTGFTTDPNPKYNYERRRRALRSTWLPPNQEAMDRLEREQGIVIRFVVGHSADPEKEAAMNEEEAQYGGFWRLPVQESYLSLANKTLLFLTEAARRYDAKYIVKIDDDVYFRLDRLPHAIRQWSDIHADYVGCMKTGDVIKTPRQRWYEPQHAVLGGSDSRYFTHGWGPVYVVAGQVASDLGALRPGSLRFFNNEDVTVGTWMLAFNVTHFDDRRLCETGCSQSSLAVYDIPGCAGLCDPVRQLPQLHNTSECHLPATTPTGGLPLADPLFIFDRRPDPAWEARAVAGLKQERRAAAAARRRQQQQERLAAAQQAALAAAGQQQALEAAAAQQAAAQAATGQEQQAAGGGQVPPPAPQQAATVQ